MTAKKKLYYKIGEACKALDIQPYVLRYWETEFTMLSPGKSRSGQRVYTEQDLDTIRRIKELLYEEGFTIAGAKKRLEADAAKGGRAKTEKKAESAKAPDAGPPPASADKPAATEPTEPAAKSAKKAPKPKAKGKPGAAKKPGKQPAEMASGDGKLDTGDSEALKTLHRRAEKALQEAKEILALLQD